MNHVEPTHKPLSAPPAQMGTALNPKGRQNRVDIGEKRALEFEQAFIAQMLQFSGLGDALVSSGGKDVESFTQFYLEALAEKITQNGGFGIAEKVYAHIINQKDNHDELGRL